MVLDLNFLEPFWKSTTKENEYLLENPLSNRGLEGEFSLPNQLSLTFEYLRQYPTFLSLGFSYGISESYANKIFHKVRPILADVVGLKNPDKLKYKNLQKVIVDVTAQPVERPQKNQELQYNGSKKKHITKTQLIINEEDSKIKHYQTELKGRKSDLKIFKETPLKISSKIKVKGNLGYLGIDKIHANTKVPHKKPNGRRTANAELTQKQKKENKKFRKKRVKIEHINRKCKCFRIVKETYRNRLNHTGQIWLIVCGLVNLNL